MAALQVPNRTTAAVYIRRSVGGRVVYVQEPYNIVSIDYGDGSPIQTYVEPHCGVTRSPSEREERYDEVRIYDNPPFPKTRIGYGGPGQ